MVTTNKLILKEQDQVIVASTGVGGPLPPGTVSLILGRSSITTKGIFVQSGVIDSDYQGEIQIMLKASGYHIIPAQMHIAQLLLLPYIISKTQNTMRGEGSFGSTDNQSVFWTESIKLNKPILQIKMKDKTFRGLTDTGANISVISNQFWPPEWPLTDSRMPVMCIGGVSQPQVSVWLLNVRGQEDR